MPASDRRVLIREFRAEMRLAERDRVRAFCQSQQERYQDRVVQRHTAPVHPALAPNQPRGLPRGCSP